MYDFEFHQPTTLAEATAALAAADDPKLLAGGQTLLPTMKQRLAMPSDLVCIADLAELKGIRADGATLEIGAGEKHADVHASAAVRGAIPALAELAGLIGDPHVRHMGTLGGSIANNDPAADYPAALLALGATVHTNERAIAVEDFFTDLFETALGETEIVVRVAFPVPRRAAYAKFPNPASRYATTGVFVADTAGGVRVAVTGAGSCVFRASAIEAALSSDFSVAAVPDDPVPASELATDLHASAEYRAALIPAMARRAVAAIVGG
jgi:carbon-monoxide dehydrogenase medium subunit